MQPRFCMLRDIKMGMIAGRGTEQNRLYYVDEIANKARFMHWLLGEFLYFLGANA